MPSYVIKIVSTYAMVSYITFFTCRTMADRSFAWAKARGLVRDNTVHGEEEARLVLEDSFANENEKGEMTNQQASGLVEDPVAKVLHFQKSYESSSPHSHL